MTVFGIGRKGVVVRPPGVTDGPIPLFATQREVESLIRSIRSATERGWFHVIEYKLPRDIDPEERTAEEPRKWDVGYVADDMGHFG